MGALTQETSGVLQPEVSVKVKGKTMPAKLKTQWNNSEFYFELTGSLQLPFDFTFQSETVEISFFNSAANSTIEHTLNAFPTSSI